MSDRWTSPGSPPPEENPQTPGSEPPHLDKGAPPPAGQGQQPPPQSWSAPPASQQQGWSGPPPGQYWNQPPQAPKPGVIPLRPLGVGEILDGAVSTARAHWRPVLAIALGIAVVTELVSILAIRLWFTGESSIAALEDNPNPTSEELRTALGELTSFASVVGVVTLLGTVLATAMLTIVVSRAVLGRPVSVEEAWADSRGRLLRLLGLVLLVSLAVVLAVAVPVLLAAFTGMDGLVVVGVIAGIALGVWIWVSLSLAAPALMLERQGVFTAMGRSWKLVQGSWWRIFGIQLLIMVMVMMVGFIVQLPSTVIIEFINPGSSSSLGTMGTDWLSLLILAAGSIIASVVTLPLSAGVTALLYMDQRIRREALDLELARAAGVDGPGPAGPTGHPGPVGPSGPTGPGPGGY